MMFGFLLSLFTGKGGAISAIAGGLEKAYADKLAAKNDGERIDADKRIAELQAKRDVLAAEANSPVNALVRGLLAAPVVILLFKVMVYDMALGEWTGGHTDAIPSDIWTVVMVVTGFYFVHDMVTRK